MRAGALLLAASLCAGLPASAIAQQAPAPAPPAAPAPLSLLDVPFLSQTEALCGGAAAAMVLRYWGASRVAAEDFAPLVDRSAGGIATTALTRAVEARGFQARPAAGTAALIGAELAEGRPVIALIEDRPGTFHYVVVVGWHARAVVLHDPARTPFVLMPPAEFARRWRASGDWMLAVAPRADGTTPPDAPAAGGSDRPAELSCEALVADGVRLAGARDLAAAERVLAEAAYRCTDAAAPLRELAGVRLLQRRWPEVASLAGQAVALDPGDAHAWRLLGTARFVAGDQDGALGAWNRAGEPAIDLVTVHGLQRTTHRRVESLLALQPETLLTPARAGRARRRLAELPAAALTRLEYVPRGSGRAEVRAHVLERTLLPRGLLTWAAIGARAAASREIGLPVSSLGRGGERLDAGWRFWPHRPAASLALHVPAAIGIVSIDLRSERQPFTDPLRADADRLAASLTLADWATGAVRWEARGGYARWQDAGTYGTAGAAATVDAGRLRLDGGIDAWLGDERFGVSHVGARWRSSSDRRGVIVEGSAALHAVHGPTPLDLWPAGDTGHARATLLRAHPVLDAGRLRVERLGRRLAQASVEAQHWWRPMPALPLGAALFVDMARTGARLAGSPVRDMDAGIGIRLAFPGGGLLRADIAHGLRDGRNAFSIGWTK